MPEIVRRIRPGFPGTKKLRVRIMILDVVLTRRAQSDLEQAFEWWTANRSKEHGIEPAPER